MPGGVFVFVTMVVLRCLQCALMAALLALLGLLAPIAHAADKLPEDSSLTWVTDDAVIVESAGEWMTDPSRPFTPRHQPVERGQPPFCSASS